MTTTHSSVRERFIDAAFRYDESFGDETFREILLEILQNNDCRPFISTCVDGDKSSMAFSTASYHSHVDILTLLLDYGINVNLKDQHGSTALIWAAEKGSEESARILLDHNVNVDAQDNDGRSPLITATQSNRANIVELLLAKNVNVDVKDSRGHTALMCASTSNFTKIAELLLDHCADRDLTDERGNTALDYATTKEMKELLMNHTTSTYVLK